MILWDIIRDFFVQNIFGGVDSNFVLYKGFFGIVGNSSSLDYGEAYTSSFMVNIGDHLSQDYDYVFSYINVGDWLSTTATIIVLIALCFFLYLVLRYIFKLFGGLFAH